MYPKTRKRVSIQTRVIPEVPGSTRWTSAQQWASPPSPGISPPDHSAGCPGWEGGCPPSQSDQRGQPTGSCRATFREACASFLQSTSSSKQNTPGVQQLRGGRGVGGLVAGCRAQGASETEGWQISPGPQAEEGPQGSITLPKGKFTRSADGK